jgi:selenophosphate synthase
MNFKNDCRAEILFDPQTAGPFLATVPQKKIHQVMLKTKELGCDLKVIGEITTGDPFIQVH